MVARSAERARQAGGTVSSTGVAGCLQGGDGGGMMRSKNWFVAFAGRLEASKPDQH
jgi:hypothetical protein